jgi:uncharacterized protein (DUF1786 family)
MTQKPIIALDIGGGTQDILLYNPLDSMENAVKLVVPSPTVIAAKRLARATDSQKNVFLSGRVMGGGSISRAVKKHLEAGFKVYSLKDPAMTIHDNLDKVASMGVEIVDNKPDHEVIEIVLGDLDMDKLAQALAEFEVDLPDTLALAIQDHGFSPGFSNRLTRFRQWQNFLDSGGKMKDLLFDHVPKDLSRWAAAAAAAPNAIFMDTCAAALWGAVLDDYAQQHLDQGLVVINAGNEHTVAFLVRKDEVWGVYEHHTSLVNPTLLADQMKRFAEGGLTHAEIFDQWGHGVAVRPGYKEIAPFGPVVITGPRREIARKLGHMAAPYGEMMLSGCFGLVEAVRQTWPDR